MRIIIVGASGLIGQRLYAAAVKGGREVIGTYNSNAMPPLLQFDMIEDHLSSRIGGINASDSVVILGAKINPNWVSENPESSRQINVTSSIKLIDEAYSAGANVLFASSEMVFDGSKGNYSENDETSPLTLYGQQKVEVEQHLLAAGRGTIIRSGWIISPEIGANCPIETTYRTLLNGDARLAHDNMFSLTGVSDVAEAILNLLDGKLEGIYHVAATPPISRADLGKWIARYSDVGSQMSFEAVSFDSLEFSEPRPAKSWLCGDRYNKLTGHQLTSSKQIVAQKVAAIDMQMTKQQTVSI